MSRKDYILIANKLKSGKHYLYGEEQEQGFTVAVNCIMRAFSEDNDKFSHARFLAYLEKDTTN